MRIVLKLTIASVGAILGAGITYLLVAVPGSIAVELLRMARSAQRVVFCTAIATALLVAALVFRSLWRAFSAHHVTQGNQNARTFRTAKRWAIRFCVIQLILLPVLTRPYWGDALRGSFFYATQFSIYMYGVVFVLTAVLLGSLLPMARAPAVLCRLLFLLAVSPLGSFVLKWGVVVVAGIAPFHNKMGLGMEILGPIPNMFIDGCLSLAALAIAASIWTLRGLSHRAKENRTGLIKESKRGRSQF